MNIERWNKFGENTLPQFGIPYEMLLFNEEYKIEGYFKSFDAQSQRLIIIKRDEYLIGEHVEIVIDYNINVKFRPLQNIMSCNLYQEV